MTSAAAFDEIFVLFDSEGEQAIAKSDIGALMRSLKLIPSDEEVATLTQSCCPGPRTATKAEVWACIQQFGAMSAHSVSAEEIKRALYIFDTRGNRKIPSKEFWAMMTTDGFGSDVFTPDEVRGFLRQLNIGDDDDVPIDALVDVFDKRGL
eukprot:c45693_g1_i1.p3 GENE.c45693_g1_i1~~c45693_g1_i1.p3  ORF type:complete len:151 (-),score=35.46 c45693_g1_i1:224-676(-)